MKQVTSTFRVCQIFRWYFLLSAVVGLVLLASIGCTTTISGAKAPSTVPLPEGYVELGSEEEISSCGFALLMIPLKNPKPVADLIEEMIKIKGGDGLVGVSSDSSSTFFILGSSNCVNIRGTVVKFD